MKRLLPKLIPDARKVVLTAYSWWAMALSLPIYVGAELLYAYTAIDLDPYVVGKITLFLYFFGLLGRILEQDARDLFRTAKLVAASVGLTMLTLWLLSMPAQAMSELQTDLQPLAPPVATSGLPSWEQTAVHAVPHTLQWEGMETTAYLDRIAVPPVWTICAGETFNVQPNEVRTEAECLASLDIHLKRYWTGYRQGVTLSGLAPETDAAFTSLTWNIGISGVLSSSALRALNAGDVADACHRLTFWNKAGNRIVRGLVNRRASEEELCLLGVGSAVL